MFNLFKKIAGKESAESGADPATEYNGFQIVPHPRQVEGGWTTEATITRVVDGETLSHHFIRADKTGSREGAVELTLNKCRQTIDQLADRIFSGP
jgi:hypothetical protein